MTAIKIIAMIVIAIIIFFPMLPFRAKVRKLSTIHALRYDEPNNKKNLYFVLLSVLFCVLVLVLLKVLNSLSNAVLEIAFIDALFAKISDKIPSNVNFISTVAIIVVVNVVIIYGYSFVKLLLKKCILDPAYGLGKRLKRKKKKRCPTCGKKMKGKVQENPEESTEEGDKKPEENGDKKPEGSEDKKRIAIREREILKKETRGKIRKFAWSLFFEGENFEYAKNWVLRTRKVLQGFIKKQMIDSIYLLKMDILLRIIIVNY